MQIKGENNYMAIKMITRPLRKKLYTLTQEELETQVKRECRAEGVPINVDSYGNIWSITHQDKPIFVAHMDTVNHNDKEFRARLLEKDGKLSRPGYVLGADDRAGVNLILNHKHKINFILTKDEEIGCLGARELAKNPTFITDLEVGTFFIELDRRGSSDILGNVHGYCEQAVVDALQEVLPTYKDTRGVFTDIDSWDDLRQGVNLSVGYHNAHSKDEYLDIAQWEYLNSKMPELAEIDRPDLRAVYTPPRRQYGNWYGYNAYAYGYNYYDRGTTWDSSYGGVAGAKKTVTCDFCFTDEGTMYEYAGYHVCEACAVGVPEEDLYESGDVQNALEDKRKVNDPKTLSDEELSKCSNCKITLYPGDKYVKIPDWEVVFCDECYEEKEMNWNV